MNVEPCYIICIFLLPAPVSGFAIEGQVILGLFIPFSALVVIVCLVRACWAWHLTFHRQKWDYDPYMDRSLRSKYPKYTSPPASRGVIIRSVHPNNHAMGQSNSVTDRKNISAPMTALAAVAHTLGTSLNQGTESQPSKPPNGRRKSSATMVALAGAARKLGAAIMKSRTSSEKERDKQDAGYVEKQCCTSQGYTIKENNKESVPSAAVQLEKIVNSEERGFFSSQRHDDVATKRPCFYIGDESTGTIQPMKKTDPSKAHKPQKNPYGEPLKNDAQRNTFLASPLYSSFSSRDLELCNNNEERFVSRSLRGREPKFSTYTKVQWARFYNGARKFILRSRSINPTSRELQRDVKLNEDIALSSLFVADGRSSNSLTENSCFGLMQTSTFLPLGTIGQTSAPRPTSRPLQRLRRKLRVQKPTRRISGFRRDHVVLPSKARSSLQRKMINKWRRQLYTKDIGGGKLPQRSIQQRHQCKLKVHNATTEDEVSCGVMNSSLTLSKDATHTFTASHYRGTRDDKGINHAFCENEDENDSRYTASVRSSGSHKRSAFGKGWSYNKNKHANEDTHSSHNASVCTSLSVDDVMRKEDEAFRNEYYRMFDELFDKATQRELEAKAMIQN